jgi:hypothetical protein
MRLLFVLAAAALVAGGLIATMKVPNVRGTERMLASYRADPLGTSKRLQAAIFECVPDSARSPVGIQFTKTVITPFYVKTLHLRMEGASKDTFRAQIGKWIMTNHPKLLTTLPEKDFLELLGYSKKIGEDEVENCILSSATLDNSSSETRLNKDLRP